MPKEEEKEKGSVSFGGIVATFGAILIALGVAWLVAMNWAAMPASVKVMLLVFFTILSFAGGIFCRVSSYEQIAKALFVLGSLLYTLSVFLVAQIFSTSASSQGVAWLWLLCFIGVAGAGILLRTDLVCGIAAIEFIIWLFVQSNAFSKGPFILAPFFIASGFILIKSAYDLFIKKSEEAHVLAIPAGLSLILFWIVLFFSIATTSQGSAYVILISVFLYTLFAYLNQSKDAIVIAIAQFIIWLLVQVFAFDGGISLLFPFFLVSGILLAGAVGKMFFRNEENAYALAIPAGLSLVLFWIILLFSLVTTLQGAAFALIVSAILYVIFAYIGESKDSLVIGLIEFLIWIGLQYVALFEITNQIVPFSILIMTYFIVGIMLYGLTQYHKSINHPFVPVYRFWTAIYVLILAYFLSFQSILPFLWAGKSAISPIVIILMAGLSLVAGIVSIFGIYSAVANNKLSGKEVISFVSLAILYILSISLSAVIPEASLQTILEQNISTQAFVFWIVNNILFISVILSVIGYGTRYQSPSLVNLGIVFFSLEIITRYIGFVLDFQGQLGGAIISIIGGIILIAGGWLIEMWRRRLVAKTSRKSNEYAIY